MSNAYVPRFPRESRPALWDRILILLKRNGRDGLTAPQLEKVVGSSAGRELAKMLEAGAVERRKGEGVSKGAGAYVYTIITGGE